LRIIRKSSFKTTPWKNGGGVTHEAVRVPESGDPFRWRISVAEVGASGPFSDFGGYHRIMVLLHGTGVRLQFAGAAPTCLGKPGDLVEFDGGIATHCELLDGACTDLNLIVAKTIGAVSARVVQSASTVAEPIAAEATVVVFVVAGSVSLQPVETGDAKTLDAPSPTLLTTWDLAVVTGATDRQLQFSCHDSRVPMHVFLASFRDTQQ
jgi:environmental stress-induced protein Ves